MIRRRYYWRVAVDRDTRAGVLLLLENRGKLDVEVAECLGFVSGHLPAMTDATRTAVDLTAKYRARGHTVNDRALTVGAMLVASPPLA